jgi:hypothetical protein
MTRSISDNVKVGTTVIEVRKNISVGFIQSVINAAKQAFVCCVALCRMHTYALP